MYFDARTWCMLVVCAGAVSARGWQWPEQQGSESVRIDTKVRFLDDGRRDKTKQRDVQSDEVPFRQPSITNGFYNQPPGAGRYPVRVEPSREQYRVDSQAAYPGQADNNDRNDGTLDSVRFCKCVSTPDCSPRQDSAEVCGSGKYLCCYKQPNKEQQNTEYFNEIDDERPMLFPGREKFFGPFQPPPNVDGGIYDEGGNRHRNNKAVLVGPGGPSGNIGPPQTSVLVGPGGPSGNIGPPQTPVLVGPDGPTGVVGPQTHQNQATSATAQRGILVGPGGPTGMIGPYQRPILVGPRGPGSGFNRGASRGVLVGPGGPTGVIGPGYGRQSGRGLLVGPGGPTGTIGPGRRLLVGPGGPTGRIGPQGYFGN